MINFKYFKYGENFFTFYEGNKYLRTGENLYIFQDNRMRDIFYKKLHNGMMASSAAFLTFEEFRQRVFLTDKVILRESKRILAFFKSLDREIKEELEIKTYFDIIDFANHFFSYYRALNLSMNKEFKNYHKWQEKYIEYFVKIKENFDEFCKRYNYLPSDWIEDFANFNGDVLASYENIIFVDIVEFPKLYKSILGELSLNHNIILNLQMEEGEFDEENLAISHIEIPITKTPPKVYLFETELEEALTIIKLKENERFHIYSPSIEENKFYDIFPNDFTISKNPTMNDTKLFKFLNIQYGILMGREEKLRDTYLLSEVMKGFENFIFREYYGLNKGDYKTLLEISQDGYKYISKEILENYRFSEIDPEFKDKVANIIFDLGEISKIENIATLYQYFIEVINLERFLESEYDSVDILEKFLEIFGIMQTNEEMDMYGGNREIFGQNIGPSLYRLLIQYMKDIVIKSNLKIREDIVVIKPLEYTKYAEWNFKAVNCFIDIVDLYIPKVSKDSLIFTEAQREELGIISDLEKKKIQKNLFLQSILAKKDTIIFTQKDEERGVSPSPFLEEFIEKNEIEIIPCKLSGDGGKSLIKELFRGEDISVLESKDLEDEIGIEKSFEDFQDGSISLGAYDISNIRNCELKFYFEKMRDLVPLRKKDSAHLDPRILGIVVHEVLETLIKNNWKNILATNTIEIPYESIEKELYLRFKDERAKLEIHMDNYIKEIVVPLLLKNIDFMFKLLDKDYRNTKIQRFQSERADRENKPFYTGKIDIYLKGRADLVVETESGNTIIDYKTGGAQEEQLDYYSIILYGENDGAKKKIYNVWKREFREVKGQMTREDLYEILKAFSDTNIYSQETKESKCKVCEYRKLCRK